VALLISTTASRTPDLVVGLPIGVYVVCPRVGNTGACGYILSHKDHQSQNSAAAVRRCSRFTAAGFATPESSVITA
jgi:hypothetical protein